MIWSVSTLLRRSGTAMPVWVVKASIGLSSPPSRCVSQVGRGDGRGVPATRGGGGDGGRDQVGAPALALPALEVAVGGRGAALARARAGRGSCPGTSSSRRSRHSAPAAVKTSSRPSSSACSLTRIEPGTTSIRTPSATCAALEHVGGGPQVLDPAVGAGAEEDGVDRDLAQRRARRSGPCTPARARRPARSSASANVGRVGHRRRRAAAPWPGLVPQVTNGRQRRPRR